MINSKIICSLIGTLLFLEALLLAVCLGLGIYYGETDYLTFGIPMLVAVAIGIGLKVLGRGAENRMSRRDGYLVVSATWVVFSLIGMLPFLISGCETRVAAAFFETMSGFTTTGATVLNNIDSLPHSILFWRSLTHWMGGMGIVFFTIAVLPQVGSGEQKLFSAEATGLKIGKLHPRISTTARWLWGLYLLLTVACTGALTLGGMDVFDAVNHGLSTVATGGFSTHQASIEYYDSILIEGIVVVFMFFSSINYTLLYLLIIKGRLRDVWRDGELRCFIVLLVFIIIYMSGVLYFMDGYTPAEALRYSVFHVVSLQSTTGFTACDFMTWHPSAWMLLFFVTAIGACAGSTSGGIKCVRVFTAYKVMANEFKHILHPRAVLPVRIGNSVVTETVVRTIFSYFICYIVLMFVGASVMMALGIPMLDSISLCMSSFSNVGPSIGWMVGPLDSWNVLPDIGLWTNSFLMLAGRLEIFSLLLPFMPAFWRDN
ncbi:MAG: TrkH family potassium uptake protein [Bacteroidaceae bacterium]|nr:TrkH family potassium uptake protein [Bacteroidaceae bacterium]